MEGYLLLFEPSSYSGIFLSVHLRAARPVHPLLELDAGVRILAQVP